MSKLAGPEGNPAVLKVAKTGPALTEEPSSYSYCPDFPFPPKGHRTFPRSRSSLICSQSESKPIQNAGRTPSRAPPLSLQRRTRRTPRRRRDAQAGPAPPRPASSLVVRKLSQLGSALTYWWKEGPRFRFSTVSRVLQPTAEQLRVILLCCTYSVAARTRKSQQTGRNSLIQRLAP